MPPSANTIVPRPRLENMLRDALAASALVLLQAPFGYGKTTLMDAVLHGRDDSAVFRVQPWHRANFIEDLVLAIREARPDFGRRTLAGATTDLASLALAHLFVTDLRHVPAELVLAIDNAEHLADDLLFSEFIAAVANDLPNHAHLLLSGRALPPLTAQTRMSRSVTIYPDTLLFLDEELGAALEFDGMPSDEMAVERATRATKG